MRIAYVTTEDPEDIRAWSGTYYYIAKALGDQSIDVDAVGPLTKNLDTVFKGKEALYRFLLGRRSPRDRELRRADHFARQITTRLRPDCDLVFAVGTLATPQLECPQPIVIWSDATFAGVVDFYPVYSGLAAGAARRGHELEMAALTRSSLVIYSSDWAAESAICDYGLERDRVAVVPFGANIDVDLSDDEARARIDDRGNTPCRLVFVGAEWERKGGQLALDIVSMLNAAGLPARLDVLGSWPRGSTPPEFVESHGFVDKSTPQGRARMRELLVRSHFFLLPTRADCSPIVLNEAAAHALPALTTDVGGIPTIVRDHVNGKLFHREAGPDEYCEYIGDVLSHPDRYRRLALSSLAEYRQRLNWHVAGTEVRRLLERVLEGR